MLPAQTRAQSTAQAILAANRAATGGASWNGKQTLTLEYAYAGQGFIGTTSSTEDLIHGAFVDNAIIGPSKTANGFDGVRAWAEEQSGTITYRDGGDNGTLAVNESYRNRHLWWRADFGGATIVDDGRKTDGGRIFDVLTVTPEGGISFDAWFDAKTHLLDRTIEMQQDLEITTFFSDYSPVNGAMIPRKEIIDDGTGAADRQVLTLTAAAFSAARPASAYFKPEQNLHDFRIEGGAAQTTVPFELINNHIYAHVSVNGSAPLLFEFDSGGESILTPATAKMLGVHVAGAQTGTGNGSATITTGTGRVRSIRIGNAVLVDQLVTVAPLFNNHAEGVNQQGMLGYEIFARFATRIDYGKRTLTFIDAKTFDSKDAGTAVPFRFYNGMPEILGSYDGIPGRFGIDTGSRTALILNRSFVQEHNLRARMKSGSVAQTGWGAGGPTYSFVTHGGILKLGDVAIAHPLTELSTDTGGTQAVRAAPNNVGSGVLKRFVVTLDYAHYRIFLKPIEGTIADLDTFDRSGMWINQDKGGFEIVNLTKDGPAEQAGLIKGDVILAVDGKPVSAMALADLRLALRNEPVGTVVRLTVRTTAGTREIALTLRDLT